MMEHQNKDQDGVPSRSSFSWPAPGNEWIYDPYYSQPFLYGHCWPSQPSAVGADLEQLPPVTSIHSRVSTPESSCDSPVRLDCSSPSHLQETNTSPVDQVKISCALIGNNYCL